MTTLADIIAALSPGNRPPWQTNYMGQGALAAPMGPGLSPPQRPPQQPQFSPFAPQASPQPGNGVLADNNAAGLALGMLPSQGAAPTPPAAQPQPQPALAPPATATDKAKGVLAASTTGDPQAISQAVLSPTQDTANGYTPEASNFNERSVYDTPKADGTPPTAEDAKAAHEQDKQQTFGQRTLGILSTPDGAALLQSIGAGLLSNKNPWIGLGHGIQMYQALHQKNLDRQVDQQKVDQQGQAIKQQGEYQQGELSIHKDDLAARRDQYAAENKYRDNSFAHTLEQDKAQLGIRQQEIAQTAALARAKLGQDAAFHGDDVRLRQDAIEAGKVGDTAVVNTVDANGNPVPLVINKRTMKVYHTDTGSGSLSEGMPEGLQTGQMAAANQKADNTDLDRIRTSARGATERIDQMDAIAKAVQENPHAFGSTLRERFVRAGADYLGVGQQALNEARQAGRSAELDGAMAKMVHQGSITENERLLLRQSLINPEGMDAPTILGLTKKLKQAAQEDLAVHASLKDRPSNVRVGDWEIQQRAAYRQQYGGPLSGQVPQTSPQATAGKLSNGMEFDFKPDGQ